MAEKTLFPSSGRRILKVHELAAEMRRSLEGQYSDIWVEGEISDLISPQSSHLYFTLKDAAARIKCVIFRSHRRFLRFIPKAGESVLIRGRISFYEARGEVQVICDYIEPRGAGALQAAFEDLKKRLQEEGLFNVDRKRPMPIFPARVGLITSSSGAVVQDILKVIGESGFKCTLLLHPVPVQGWGAAEKIAEALDTMNQLGDGTSDPMDLLILARGGGSLEDLWTFNEEVLARAIARSKIPVISAIGHESDTTISDYVADMRAPTPSIAAEMFVNRGLAFVERMTSAHRRLIELMLSGIEDARNRISTHVRLLRSPSHQVQASRDSVDYFSLRLCQAMRRQFEEGRGRIQRATEGLAHLSPLGQLEDFKRRLDHLSRGLHNEGRRLIAYWKAFLEDRMAQLNLLSPLNILGRGYSITRKVSGLSVVRSAAEVSVRDKVCIRLHRGQLTCAVEHKEEI